MYHVGLDSHNCYPVLLDDIIQEMKDKVKECLAFLDEESAVSAQEIEETSTEVAEDPAAAISEIKEFTAGPSISSNVYPKKNYALDLIGSRCDKCVHTWPTCGDNDCLGGCKTYHKDPPDGGFYG